MLDKIKKQNDDYFVNIYNGRYPLCFTGGDGVVLHDISGKDYVDFTAGIAVNCLGYNHQKLSQTIINKATGVTHCSNLYYVQEQAQLAQMLCELSFGDKVFFANSGTEANEGAVKMAMRYFYTKGETKHKVITLNSSFHGRTISMVAATGQKKYQKPYQPVDSNFVNVDSKSLETIKNAIDDSTCAIMIEPMQCEGGLVTFDTEYIQGIRNICDKYGILLIFDEVQTGIGRTGKMFAYEHFSIVPDIMTLAKGLGGGVPIGAIVATDEAHTFMPGDHGTTFGGNPLACACGVTVLETIIEEKILDNVNTVGNHLGKSLDKLANKYSFAIKSVGMGLARGLRLDDSIVTNGEIINKMLDKGYLLVAAASNTLRMVPPLIMDIDNVNNMIDALDSVLSDIEV